MCLSVETADLGPLAVILDRPSNMMLVSWRLTDDQAFEAIRDMLERSGIPQLVAGRAMCHCGMFLRATGDVPVLVPA